MYSICLILFGIDATVPPNARIGDKDQNTLAKNGLLTIMEQIWISSS